MKKLCSAVLAMFIVFALLLTGCTSQKASTDTPSNTASAPSSSSPASPAEKKSCVFRAVMPAMDSQYWTVTIGYALKYAVEDFVAEHPDVTVDYQMMGPSAEKDTENFLNILEDVVSKSPDMLLVCSMAEDATTPIIKEAYERNIHTNMMGFEIDIPKEYLKSYWTSANKEIGELCAQEFYDTLIEKKLPLDKTVGMYMSIVNPSLEIKLNAFRSKLQELCPKMTILETKYNENDVNAGIGQIEADISAQGDKIVGYFSGNNTTGIALARALESAKLSQDSYVAISIDSDAEEISAMEKGTLDGLIIQAGYSAAYKHVIDMLNNYFYGKDMEYAYKALPTYVTTMEGLDPVVLGDVDPTKVDRSKK